MKVLGIDYSLNGTGLSVYDGKKVTYKKVFTTVKKNLSENKEVFILSPNFDNYEYKIDWVVDQIINCTKYDFVCMEDHLGSYYNWMDGYGIIKHYLRKNNIPYIMISPTQLKRYAGSGKADKDMMSVFLQQEYGLNFDYIGKLANNIVDATWLAIVGYEYNKFLNSEKSSLNTERYKIMLKLVEKHRSKDANKE